ncbi:hypothetical protein BaRGS_00022965 [Batillaria attramentaria]|uniref:Uncharacterized protein n=1 Tax=Batillaria attramentaria TaxID=370345 RepID=A0ABD0KFF6_9CAEN
MADSSTFLLIFGILVTVCHVSVRSTPLVGGEGRSDHAYIHKRAPSGHVIQAHVNANHQQNVIGSHFVGVTYDSGQAAKNFSGFDFSSRKLQNLARALTPGYFRFGGTMSDCMLFESASTSFVDECTPAPGRNFHTFTLTGHQWQALNQFVHKVGFDFIFDANDLQRTSHGDWSPDNTRKLLQYSADRHYPIAGFQLGNEYDLFHSFFGYDLSAAQLAKDYAKFQSLLKEFPQYSSSFLIGPEAAHARPDHFKNYYFSGLTSTVDDYTDVHKMDSLRKVLTEALAETHAVDPHLPVWLTETGSAYSGGTKHVSDRFAAGFLWLDKLGVAAEMGIETLLRQDLFGGNYPLIDRQLNPTPDYWLTLLYKQLVRGFHAGAVVLYYLNPNGYSVTFDFPQFTSHKRLLYILTAGDSDGLLSKFVALNGAKLQLHGDSVPQLHPLEQAAGPVVTPPHSFGFVVLPDNRVDLCRHSGELVG